MIWGGLVTSQSWEVMPHRGQQRQRPGRALGLVLGLTRPGGKVLGLTRPGGQVGLARQGRSPPFERSHRRGITPTGDPGDRRTGAAGKQRKHGGGKRSNRRGSGRGGRQKKNRKSKSLEQREREVSKQDWHFARGRGATSPRNRWTGIGATAPKNREPVLDATSLFEENLKKPIRTREGKQGSLEDSFVIGPDNQVLDARELFDDFGDNDIDDFEGFKATDGDIGIVDVSLSLEPGSVVDLENPDGGIEVVSVSISAENSTKPLQPHDDPFEDNTKETSDSTATDKEKDGKKNRKDDIKKYTPKDPKKKLKEKARAGEQKFPNNIRDVLSDFAFPSRFDKNNFPPKQLSVPRVDDKISQFTDSEDPTTSTTTKGPTTSTTTLPPPKSESTTAIDFVSTTILPTTFESTSTTDIPTTTTYEELENIETTTQILNNLDQDIEADVKNITEETESSSDEQTTTETTTNSADVVTQSNQLYNDNVENEPEMTTNRPEEEDSFTEDFEDLVYNDLENEVSNNPFEGDTESKKLRKSKSQYCREAEGGTFPRW